MMPALQRYVTELSRNTFLLAFASLFADISTEMLPGAASLLRLVSGELDELFRGYEMEEWRRHRDLQESMPPLGDWDTWPPDDI
jgi:hypothetical protein